MASGEEVSSAERVPISFTPVQGKGKAKQSTKAMTLYKLAGLTGESVDLALTAPTGANLGDVCINAGSVKLLRDQTGVKGTEAFELVRNGANTWTLKFKNGVPKAFTSGGKATKLKGSYTIKLDLWAKGTYDDSSGKPTPLQVYDKKAKKWVNKSKPTTVKVKVTIK